MSFKTMRAALVAAALGSVAAAALTPAMAQDAAKPAAAPATKPAAGTLADDPVVARANGKEFKRSDVLALLQQLDPQVQQMPLQMIYPQLVDQLVQAQLVTEAGYKAKLQDSAEVKRRLKQAEEQFVQQAWLKAEIDKKLTPEKLKAAYDKWIKENPPQDEVKASHILVKTKEEADAIIKQLKGGADFAKLAAEKGTDGTKETGGDLGYFVKDQMVKPFSDAAFAMKVGDISQTPVQTDFGFHVIKLADKRKQVPPTFEQATPQLRQMVAQEIAEDVVKGLEKTAKVEKFNIDGSPMVAAPAAPAPQKK
ncbi:peptidylprolyl isomerase [Niveispirillum sp. KHB5.9]|uniref:peptidylprolyl isomerase n=1 Tax=Niveispirillum sp. KHB5.9 TaxID=3400269 RepID=UPI003A8415E7